MSSFHAKSKITLKNGEKREACEMVERVIRLRDGALADGSLMELEKPTTPAGQHFYVDPGEVALIEPVRW